MVKWETFLQRFADLEKQMKKAAQDIVMKFNTEVVKLQNEQLLAGKNVNDKTMQRGYSPAYARRRQRAGLQTGFVDLKFTGRYQDTKKLVKYDYGVDIRSAADYEAHLRANFPDHVGLNKANAEVIADKMADDLAKEIDKYLGK